MIQSGDAVIIDKIVLTESTLREMCDDVGYLSQMWVDYQMMLQMATENTPLLVKSVSDGEEEGTYRVNLINREDDLENAATWVWPTSISRKVKNPYTPGKPVRQIKEFRGRKSNGILRVESTNSVTGMVSIVGLEHRIPYYLLGKASTTTSEII